MELEKIAVMSPRLTRTGIAQVVGTGEYAVLVRDIPVGFLDKSKTRLEKKLKN